MYKAVKMKNNRHVRKVSYEIHTIKLQKNIRIQYTQAALKVSPGR